MPVGPSRGDYLLAGLDGSGDSIDAQLIAFPRSLRLEFKGGETAPEVRDLSDKRVDTIGYIRALSSIQSLAVLDDSGSSLATASPPPVEVAGFLEPGEGVGFVSPAWALEGSFLDIQEKLKDPPTREKILEVVIWNYMNLASIIPQMSVTYRAFQEQVNKLSYRIPFCTCI